jgi:hypothetical protein
LWRGATLRPREGRSQGSRPTVRHCTVWPCTGSDAEPPSTAWRKTRVAYCWRPSRIARGGSKTRPSAGPPNPSSNRARHDNLNLGSHRHQSSSARSSGTTHRRPRPRVLPTRHLTCDTTNGALHREEVDDRVRAAARAASKRCRPATWRAAGPPSGCSEPSAGPTAPSAHTDLATLAVAIERDRYGSATTLPRQRRRPLRSRPPDHHTTNATARFHGDRDIFVLGLCQPLQRRGSLPQLLRFPMVPSFS